MTYKARFLLMLCCITFGCVQAQDNDDLFARIQALSNTGVDFYNVDGMDITTRELQAEFTPKDICKKFGQAEGKRFSIKEQELSATDGSTDLEHFYVLKSTQEDGNIILNVSNYFIKTAEGKVTRLTFSAMNKTDKELERSFVQLVKNDAIPDSIFSRLEVDTVNFAGRNIVLGPTCRWQGPNNLQCPMKGQMNWSVHKSMDDAVQSINNQFEKVKAQNGSKIVSDTTIRVIFEGIETDAKKIVYGFKGVKSALVNLSGGKTLTIYLIAAAVRGHYVSCVMSSWDTDYHLANGLSPLEAEVMQLKE